MATQAMQLKATTPLLRVAKNSLFALIGAGALVFLAQTFVFRIAGVSSASMAPTLQPGDSVLVDRLAYDLQSPRRGDIIVFQFPQADGRDFVKRVIGLPGDVVGEIDGRFTVNGVDVPESRPSSPTETAITPMNLPPREVPAGQLYVLGDNRDASLDSRFWGTVEERKVVGKAMFILWSSGRHWWEVRWNRIGEWLW